MSAHTLPLIDSSVYAAACVLAFAPHLRVCATQGLRVLKLVKLGSAARAIQGYGNGLDGSLKENGGNMSFGQQQLLCLARALLQSSLIVCEEEAAVCVDSSAETMIQRVSAHSRQAGGLVLVHVRVMSASDA